MKMVEKKYTSIVNTNDCEEEEDHANNNNNNNNNVIKFVKVQ